jgi:hypothetical protein
MQVPDKRTPYSPDEQPRVSTLHVRSRVPVLGFLKSGSGFKVCEHPLRGLRLDKNNGYNYRTWSWDLMALMGLRLL